MTTLEELIAEAQKNPDPTPKQSIELDIFSLSWAADEIVAKCPIQANEIRTIAKKLGEYISQLHRDRDAIEKDLANIRREANEARRHLRILSGWANEISRLAHFKPQAE